MKKIIRHFFEEGTKNYYRKGDIIISPNNIPPGVFYILDGFVKEYSFTESGEEKISCIYKRGEIISLLWVFKDNPINKFYEALDTVKVGIRPKSEFFTFINQPAVEKEMLSILVSYIDLYSFRLNNLELSNVKSRLISRLILLAKRFGKAVNGSISIENIFNQKVIAASINTSRETVNRLLRELSEKKLVIVKGDSIDVTSIARLEEELSLANSV